MKESLIQTAVAGDSPSDSGCKRLFIKQQMQETLYQTADAGALDHTADAGVFLSNS